MEIIHVVLGKANPNRMNGVNKVVYQLATEQVRANKSASVWGISKDLTHNYGERLFKTELFKSQRNPFSIDANLMKRILEKKGRAFFHIHGGWIPAFYTVSKFLFENNMPFVFTPHGAYNSIAIEKNKKVKLFYFRFFEKKILERASKIHCIGKSEIQGLNKLYETNKTYLLPYGFEIKSIESPIEKEQNSFFTVGFVGRIDVYTKGLDLLLEAFSKFAEKEPESRLWIVGDGLDADKLKKHILSCKNHENITCFGAKFGIDKDLLIVKMDVFVHPSRNEGLPSAVIEAASFGIPSIVSEATNVGEYIVKYNCGRLIENNNSDALFNALVEMKSQWDIDALRKYKENSLVMVKESFDWSNIVNAFDNLYCEH